MKKYISVAVVSILYILNIGAQNPIPSVDIQTLEGTTFNTSKISNNGKPIILFFWESFCKPCLTEFDNIQENYVDWQEETGVKVVAISIDDTRTQSKVLPLVSSKGWEFEFYLDINRDFKRLMGVNACPHTFLVDGNGNVVWQITGYSPGQENDVYEKVKKLAKGETLD